MNIPKTAISMDLRKFRQSGFKEEFILDGGIYVPREMQIEAIHEHQDSRYAMIVGPTGNGKSKAIWTISMIQLNRKLIRKAVVLVPQTIIGKSYDDGIMRVDGIGDVEWIVAPKDRLTSPTTSDIVKTAHVKEFLRSKRKTLVCTYHSFVAAYKSLSKKDKKALFAGVMVWVDECHHLAFAKNGQRAEFNCLGHIIDELLENVPTCRIGMATATYCRGDLGAILKPETYSKFKVYEYSYDRYFKAMKYLETFEFKFIPYQRKKGEFPPAKIIAEMFDKWNAKTIAYVPSVNSSCSHGKDHEVQKIMEALGTDEAGKTEYPEDENGIIHITRPDGTKLKVMNLVAEEGRNVKKAYIEEIRNDKDPEIRERNRQKLDMIIALGMFKEGADWEFAERSVIIGYRGSLVEMVQITGRLFRDIPGKKHVEVNNLIEATLATQTDEFEGDLNKVMLSIFGVMLMEDVFSPIRMESERSDKPGSKDGYFDYLAAAIPADKRQDFFGSVFSDVINKLKNCNDGAVVERFRDEEFEGIVKKHLKDGGFDDSHLDLISEKVWRMFTRRGLRTQGLDINDVGIKIIRRSNPLAGIVEYLSDKRNSESLEMIKKAFQDSRITPEEWVHIAELLEKKNGGSLPCNSEMIRMREHNSFMAELNK